MIRLNYHLKKDTDIVSLELELKLVYVPDAV